MNKITHKIKTYYDIMSPQQKHSEAKSPSFGNFFQDKVITEEAPHENLKNHQIEVFLQNIKHATTSDENNYVKSFILGDNPKMINKEVLKKLLLNSLEGFNSNVLMFEKIDENIEKIDWFSLNYVSMIFSYLNYLKKIMQDFKRDGINNFSKISLFLQNEDKILDLLTEKTIENNDFFDSSEISERFFLETEEIVKFLDNLFKNTSFSQLNISSSNSRLFFKNEIFFSDSGDQLSWNSKFVITCGFFTNRMNFSSFNHIAQTLIESNEKTSNSVENQRVLKGLAENAGLSILCTGEANSIDFMSFIEKLLKIAQITQKITRNKLNDITDYVKSIQQLHKLINIREYEISNYKLNYFLKEKENDELKLQIAQLESNLLFYEEQQNISILQENEEISNQNQENHNKIIKNNGIIYNNDVFNVFNEKSSVDLMDIPSLIKINEIMKTGENIGFFNKNAENLKNTKKVNTTKNIIKSESYSNVMLASSNMKKNNEFTKMEGQEQLLEINYYEELNLLREKFHKTNKEMLKLKVDSDKHRENTEKYKQNSEKLKEVSDKLKEISEKYKETQKLLEIKEKEISILKKLNEEQKTIFLIKSENFEEEILRIKGELDGNLSILYGNVNKNEVLDIVYENIKGKVKAILEELALKYRKNKELQHELIDLYNIYYKKLVKK